jgi:AmmeMemoRadiSam system protein B
VAPHLDPRRAGPTIARALLELGERPPAPLRVVIFGTGHELIGDLYALTRKHFQTPLGKAMCDTTFVDAVAARLGDRAYHSELAHQHEHSIEFAVLYLQRRLRGQPFTIVPVLCGGFHSLLDDGRTARQSEEFEGLIQAVRETATEQSGATLYLAGVDLSHVGPRFGDPGTDDRVRAEIEASDREALEAVRRGDADGWFDSIARHSDATRICGFAPTYAMLRCAAPGEGRLLRYQQSLEEDASLVSIAAMVWP